MKAFRDDKILRRGVAGESAQERVEQRHALAARPRIQQPLADVLSGKAAQGDRAVAETCRVNLQQRAEPLWLQYHSGQGERSGREGLSGPRPLAVDERRRTTAAAERTPIRRRAQ